MQWVVYSYESLKEAHKEGSFDWADDWPIEWGRPSEVWEKAKHGTTGLPGRVETSESNAHLIAAAPDLLKACRAALPFVLNNKRVWKIVDRAIVKAGR